MSKGKDLTARQARFVDEYLLDANGTQAAIRAGYSTSGARVTAHRLLTHDAVSQAIEARQRMDSARLRVEREDVLAALLGTVHLAREQMNPMAMVSGLREIGKLLGFYAPQRVQMTLDEGAAAEVRRLEAMSDEELARMVRSAPEVGRG